jgi:hypothetical protein
MFALKLDKKSAPTTDYSPSPSAFRGSQRWNYFLLVMGLIEGELKAKPMALQLLADGMSPERVVTLTQLPLSTIMSLIDTGVAICNRSVNSILRLICLHS